MQPGPRSHEALLRAAVAGVLVLFLAWAAGAVTTKTAAGAIGFGLWPAVTTFLGYRADGTGDRPAATPGGET
jgi:hypothetical protein